MPQGYSRRGIRTMKKIVLWSLMVWSSAGSFLIGQNVDFARATAVDTPFVKIPHKTFAIPCEACHTTESWKLLKSTVDFDHTKTGFVLRGAHAATSCAGCHRGGLFNATVRECLACHPEPHRGQLGADCQRCHSEEAWVPSRFVHDEQSFVFLGPHRALDCADCHHDLLTFKMPDINRCADCHRATGVQPAHAQWELLGDCSACHSQSAWDAYPHYDGWFSLTGHHRRSCETCHRQAPDYSTYTCRECHRFDHKGGDD